MLARADVAGDAVDLLDGHEQPVALGVVQLEDTRARRPRRCADQPVEARDAVLDVHDVVAGREVGEEGLAVRRRPDAPPLREAEDLRVGPERQLRGRELPSRRQRPGDARRPALMSTRSAAGTSFAATPSSTSVRPAAPPVVKR